MAKIDEELAATNPFAYLNFILQFCPPVGPASVEKPLREKFDEMGIEAGPPFAFEMLSPDERAALEAILENHYG